ncbi:translation initiation factor IF-2-like [Nycticebus coucang]|uniref:translation initiation factor IF-2-like n=1 Tax=Nycticebus coucang TaxID=9470 RepID=UPI00234DDB81|nr:translation initiation factor IF-2-like [Nycticebus coucang]
MDPRVGGGGRRRAGEVAAGTGLIFHSGFLFRAASSGGRGEESSGPSPAPAPPRTCRGHCLFPAASLPSRRTADDPRPRRPSPSAPRFPAVQPGASRSPRCPPGRPKETHAAAALFGPRMRGPDAVLAPHPAVAPNVEWGGGGWKALRWRWAWPVARAGGAVARRSPSSLAGRAVSTADAWRAPAPRGLGRGGAAPRVPNSGDGAGAAKPGPSPVPKTLKTRPPARSWKGPGEGVWLLSTFFWGKKWAEGSVAAYGFCP